MCIAIVAPKGHRVPDAILDKGAKQNRHGGGFAYIDDKGKIAIRKGFFKIDDFLDAYSTTYDKYGVNNPMLLHFRHATMGRVTMHNCHPFAIADGALIHNGHLRGWTGGIEANDSDTKQFVSAIHNNMKYEDALAARLDISRAVGWHNKIATLHDNGEFILFNQTAWTNHDGIFYSNRGPLP